LIIAIQISLLGAAISTNHNPILELMVFILAPDPEKFKQLIIGKIHRLRPS
jgi:hypothetical protein